MKKFIPLLILISFNIFAYTGVTIPTRVTHIGPDANKDYDAEESSLAVNTQNNEYYMVFEATQSLSGTGANTVAEVEIYAQRVNAITGFNIGLPSRISHGT